MTRIRQPSTQRRQPAQPVSWLPRPLNLPRVRQSPADSVVSAPDLNDYATEDEGTPGPAWTGSSDPSAGGSVEPMPPGIDVSPGGYGEGPTGG